MTSEVVDANPVAGKYAVALSFGDLVDNSGAFVKQTMSYEVFWTDSAGRPTGNRVAEIAAKTSSVTCCKAKKYKINIRGNYASNYDGTARLAIRAKSANGAILPFFSYSNAIADKSTGEMRKMTGSFTVKLSKADAKSLGTNPRAKDAFSAAFATTIGFEPEEVFVTKITVDGTQVFPPVAAGGRRLVSHNTGEVKVDYEILTSSGKTVAKADINLDNLKANIQAEAAEIGVTVTVASMTVSDVATATVGTPVMTGAASGVFFHMMALVLAAGAHFWF